MNIRLYCPQCETPGRLSLPCPPSWSCPSCDHVVTLAQPHPDPALPSCACCGNAELYKKKDFSHALGMGILLAGIAGSTVAYFLYNIYLTWAILLGSAALDCLLYLIVKDVIVCYRCGTEHRGIPSGPEHHPFELTIHERYRQERLRKEQIGG